MTRRPATKLDREIAGIGDLSRDELADRWTKMYGCPPPPGVRRELLSHAVAWNMQAKQLGGLSAASRKALKAAVGQLGNKVVENADKRRFSPAKADPNSAPGEENIRSSDLTENVVEPTKAAAASERTPIKAGARLIRQWNGKANVVDVTDDGFVFEGTVYRSLSAIARKITGAHWSGPRFFGL